jgi:hypothetical protein
MIFPKQQFVAYCFYRFKKCISIGKAAIEKRKASVGRRYKISV